jgi:acetyltransferase-like isoleucine patch superfamily enzyme
MRKNEKREVRLEEDQMRHFDEDWHPHGVPPNVRIGENCYFSSSMGFERIESTNGISLSLGNEVGLYDQFAFEIGETGKVSIGDYSILNGARVRSVESITIGNYCMVSWGTYITDSWIKPSENQIIRPSGVKLESLGYQAPVVLGDNVWVGFGCVIFPGVTIGEGAVVASKTIVDKDVKPYTVVAGSPMRVIKELSK